VTKNRILDELNEHNWSKKFCSLAPCGFKLYLKNKKGSINNKKIMIYSLANIFD